MNSIAITHNYSSLSPASCGLVQTSTISAYDNFGSVPSSSPITSLRRGRSSASIRMCKVSCYISRSEKYNLRDVFMVDKLYPEDMIRSSFG